MPGRHARLPVRQGMIRKCQPVGPRFQRAGCFEKQADIRDIRRRRRAGPKLPGQLQQCVQFTKSCMFHAKVTAGARFRLAPPVIVMKEACVYWGIRCLYCRPLW